jgi:hypothetical protein
MESRLQRKMMKAAEARGCRAVKMHVEGRAGWPDLLVICPGGRVGFVEVKTPTGRLSPMQGRVIGQLEDLGVPVTVARSVAEFEAFLDSL